MVKNWSGGIRTFTNMRGHAYAQATLVKPHNGYQGHGMHSSFASLPSSPSTERTPNGEGYDSGMHPGPRPIVGLIGHWLNQVAG